MLDAWIPDRNNACGFDPQSRFSVATHYILNGPGFAQRADVNQRAETRSGATLWAQARLSPGDYTLYLYDDAGGGCRCNAVNHCGGAQVIVRVFADSVGVHYTGP